MLEEITRRVGFYRILRTVLRGGLKNFLIRSINSFRRSRLKKLKTPDAIVLFVTNNCQMGCEFCFYKNKLNVTEEQMSVAEIERLAKSLKKVFRIVLTGGEPFLRDDLDEICGVFDKCCRIGWVSIVTNGFLTEKIQNKVKAILNNTRLKYLRIQISIDGLTEKHDRLRNVYGAFKNAVATLYALRNLQKSYKNLYIEIASVVNAFLINEIEEFVDYFQNFRVPIKFSIIRSPDFGLSGLAEEDSSNLLADSNLIFPSLEKLENFYDTVKELNCRSKYRFWTPFQQKKFENSLKILKRKERILPCYAGRVDAVIYPNSDVAFCENTAPIGNLRKHNFDFYSLWQSEKANIFREKIKKCVCIQGCNLITSMSYDDETLTSVL